MVKKNKVIALKDIPGFVREGDRLWTGGWTVVRKPMAMVWELIRSGKKKLHLVANPGGPEFDLMAGCDCISKTETNYIGHEVFGHPYNWRRKLDEPDGEEFYHDDWTVKTGALRIVAGSMGIPFIPSKSLLGSDIINPEYDGFKELRGKDKKVPRRKVKLMDDPFWDGDTVVLLPALNPDVCLIHAQKVGEDGTVLITGGTFLDYYAALASEVTIVSAEKIVSREEIENTAEMNKIPGMVVDAILEVPYGAHPTALHNYYDNDPWWFRDYLEASKDVQKMREWSKKWVHGPKDYREYLELLGKKRLKKLCADGQKGYNPEMKRRLDRLEEVPSE